MKTPIRFPLFFQLMTILVLAKVQYAFTQPYSNSLIGENSVYQSNNIITRDESDIEVPPAKTVWGSLSYELNIRLLDFSVILEDNTTLLGWSIIPSDILGRFEIERSLDNINFKKIKTLERKLSLNEAHHFKLNDDISDIASGLIYYRLKIVGVNGQLKYSEVRAVRKNGKKVIVNVFPDPSKDEVILEIHTEKDGEGIIRIIDNSGTIVSSQVKKFKQGLNTIYLKDLSKYSNGVYNFQCLIEADVMLKKISIKN